MLIRISGGSEGIEDYLEQGQKKGRDFDRNELDERIILDGDLDATREIISAVKGEGEKYLHITLAFREDEVSRETLDAITQEFKYFTFAAYDPDEYSFYAEAHLPRIKSYTHQQTGEFLERKPHVHIVIPEINLLSGHKLNPFGRVEHQIKFLEAIQEHINDKYGLASPKDHRRVEFTGESEMISRYKGDIFSGQNKEFREQVLTELMDRGLTRYEDFHAMLGEFGEVRVRNKGKDIEYLNVKRPGEEKGINLKDFVFRREFVELTPEGKGARLAAEARKHYETAGPSRLTPEDLETRLTEWRNVRARELKYINSGNRTLYERYREAAPEGRETILAEREARFYSKYRDTSNDRIDNGRRVERIRDNLRTADRHLESTRGAAGRADAIAGNLAGRRTRRALERAVDAINAGRGRDQGEVGVTRIKRRSDSVTGQLAHDLEEGRQQRQAGGLADWQEIKQRLDARRLLAHLSDSHGVIPEKYEVLEGKDGAPRIRAGTRNLNVSDFLTKELNLPWSEASGILREVYAEQIGRDPEPQRRQQPRQQLWQEYQEHRKRERAQRATRWDEQRQSETTRRQALKREWYARRSAIQGNRMLKGASRKAALSVARMERVIQEQTLRAEIQAERGALKAAARAPQAEQYREFLRRRAEAGDGRALAELRRVCQPRRDGGGQPAADPFGQVVAHGPAPYRFQPANNPSYYVILRDARGHEQIMWGVDLERGIQEAGAGVGDRMRLVREGRRTVIVRTNANGKVIETTAQRASWRAERVAGDDGAGELHIEPATQQPTEREAEPLRMTTPGLSYRVHANGDVTYRRAGLTVLRDEGRAVRVFQSDDDNTEMALRLARAKFGRRLVLNGDEAFQIRAARMAAERGIQVEFADPRLNAILVAHKADLEVARAAARRTRAGQGTQPDRAHESTPVDPNTRSGRYTGPITAIDVEYIYQQHGREIVRHARGRFSTVPAPGEIVRIMYRDELMTVQKERAVQRERDEGPAR